MLSLNFMYSMERFATAVYRSQNASNLKKRIIELENRPAGISVFFQMAGSILGTASRCFGKPLALKTDVAIEKRAVKDYSYFHRTLKLDEQTKQLIKNIIADEEEHIKNWQDAIGVVKGGKQP